MEQIFAAGALQQLLDSCPTPAARRDVWRIAEHLPSLSAASRLRANTLRQLAAGELLQAYGFGGAAAAAGGDGDIAGGGGGAERQQGREELRAILACLAAAPSCAKLSALVSNALGLPWGPDGAAAADKRAAEGAGGDEEGAEEEDDDEDDDIRCKACGKAQPDHNLLLCDGCDLAYHTTCLRPRLAAVPDSEWFCPGCDKDIRGSTLAPEGAIE